MMKSRNVNSGMLIVVFVLFALLGAANVSEAQNASGTAKTRLAVVGLDHDHVWSLLKDIAGEPSAELIAIAESDAALVSRAQKEVGASVKFYADYVAMLDEAKPEAVIVTTSNDRQAAHSLLNRKAHGHERRGCAGDGTASAGSEDQTDGELLERVGGSKPRNISSRARRRSWTHPENHRAVWPSRAEGDWGFAAVRELAL
jgi:hypothetical protein